jgi:hypothetical protein
MNVACTSVRCIWATCLLMDDGEFGLIDIADLRIFPSPCAMPCANATCATCNVTRRTATGCSKRSCKRCLMAMPSLAPEIAVGRLRRQIEQLGQTGSTVS